MTVCSVALIEDERPASDFDRAEYRRGVLHSAINYEGHPIVVGPLENLRAKSVADSVRRFARDMGARIKQKRVPIAGGMVNLVLRAEEGE